MKKLILACTVMLMACISQAAYVDWEINLGKTDYAEKQYYIFAIGDSETVLGYLGALGDTTATDLSTLALVSGTLNKKAGKASGGALDVGDATSVFMVVLNDMLVDGTSFIYDSMDVSSYLYTPPGTPNADDPTFIADAGKFTQSGTIAAAAGPVIPGGDVPEPTSGILLVVGSALLALRRKQK